MCGGASMAYMVKNWASMAYMVCKPIFSLSLGQAEQKEEEEVPTSKFAIR